MRAPISPVGRTRIRILFPARAKQSLVIGSANWRLEDCVFEWANGRGLTIRDGALGEISFERTVPQVKSRRASGRASPPDEVPDKPKKRATAPAP
ncbi:MAG: hypothetical protein Q7S40_14015 [Opitutaceae bacterium]|nr:hypothetical protein [Opitutaceae bacterium]